AGGSIPAGLFFSLVIMPELDQHIVAGLHAIQHRLPKPFSQERLRAAPVPRPVVDRYVRIEETGKRHAPARLGICLSFLVRHRRIPNQPDPDLFLPRQKSDEEQGRYETSNSHNPATGSGLRPTPPAVSATARCGWA